MKRVADVISTERAPLPAGTWDSRRVVTRVSRTAIRSSALRATARRAYAGQAGVGWRSIGRSPTAIRLKNTGGGHRRGRPILADRA